MPGRRALTRSMRIDRIQMLQDFQHKNDLAATFKEERVMPLATGANSVRTFASPEEQQHMAICHPASVQMLEGFLKSLGELDRKRALEVACGDGRLTRDLLAKWYEEVDMFDQCPVAVELVKQLRREVNSI